MVTTAPKVSFFHYFGMPMTEEEEADAEENEDEDAVHVRFYATVSLLCFYSAVVEEVFFCRR